jgi:hypothetical protein
MGRPKIYIEGMHQLNIAYPRRYDELFRLLRVYSVVTGKPMWRIIIEALEKYFGMFQATQNHMQDDNITSD